MNEIWKPVKGYENKYEVSNLGNIKGLISKKQLSLSRINKGRGSKFGYIRVSLCGRNYYLHKIVAEAFLENPEYKKYVDHIDGNSLNNNVENLKWVTAYENNKNPITKKRRFEYNEKKKQQTIIRKQQLKIFNSLLPKKPKELKNAKYWYNGQTLSSYCKKVGLNIYTVRDRIRKLGMSIDDAVKFPVLTQREKTLKRFGKYKWTKKED